MAAERNEGTEQARGGGAERATAAVVGGSAQARRLAQASRPAALERREVGRILSRLGGDLGQKNIVGDVHVTLSMQTPWVADRGYLNLINPQSVFADDPNAGFISPEGGNVEGAVELWLRGLETGASYFVQFRVGSYPKLLNQPGQWKISSSEGPHVFFQATGPGQTIPVVLTEADGPLALVRLTSTGLGGWVFYDVEVSKLG